MRQILETLCNSSVSEAISVCNELGVKTTDDNGNCRNFYDVLSDLAKVINS